jgi:hypothetical protein
VRPSFVRAVAIWWKNGPFGSFTGPPGLLAEGVQTSRPCVTDAGLGAVGVGGVEGLELQPPPGAATITIAPTIHAPRR